MDPRETGLGITVLGSGSQGNATVLHSSSEGVLIDAGFSAREIRNRLQNAGVDERILKAIVVSHEHADHVKGLRVFAKQLQIPIYANRNTATILRRRDAQFGQMYLFATGSPFSIAGFTVETFSIPHDANDPVAFLIRWQDRRIGIATDLGHVSRLVLYQLRECDALIVESNHDIQMLGQSPRPWALKQRILSRHGHLSNEACIELLQFIIHPRTRHVIMAHASQECNQYELIEAMGAKCLEDLGRLDIGLSVARQDAPLPTVWI